MPDAASDYFEALDVYSSRLLELAEPGSPADTYAQLQLAQYEAVRAAGYPVLELHTTHQVEDTNIRACREDDVCWVFSNFTVGPTGRLASFKTDGTPVGWLVVAGGDMDAVDGTVLELVGAIELPGGARRLNRALNVVVRVRTDSKAINSESGGVLAQWGGSLYRDPEGRAVGVEKWFGPSSVQPHTTATFVFHFPGASPGGTFRVAGYVEDWDRTWEALLKVPPGF